MKRIANWNAQKRNACLSEFRRMVRGHLPEKVDNAIAAGRSLAHLMNDSRVILLGIDDVQLERFRRRYAVPSNLKGIMYGVATGKLTDAMLETRLNRKFPNYWLWRKQTDGSQTGKLRLVDRCLLCAKRTCRCVVGTMGEKESATNADGSQTQAQEKGHKYRKASSHSGRRLDARSANQPRACVSRGTKTHGTRQDSTECRRRPQGTKDARHFARLSTRHQRFASLIGKVVSVRGIAQ